MGGSKFHQGSIFRTTSQGTFIPNPSLLDTTYTQCLYMIVLLFWLWLKISV
uniref:Uncharacterized protein n=1 Tax=Rhizophora mucronata TaxID=61149 RepID=A0A2P2Q9S1_RHIMU